jgi:hypothetical protein
VTEAFNSSNFTSNNTSETNLISKNTPVNEIIQDQSRPDPEIKLKSFSQTGVLHFEFNQPFIVPRNLTFIDSSVLNISIYILPENDR